MMFVTLSNPQINFLNIRNNQIKEMHRVMLNYTFLTIKIWDDVRSADMDGFKIFILEAFCFALHVFQDSVSGAVGFQPNGSVLLIATCH